MDKAIRRQINAFEKKAGEAARLKGKAANLLQRAGDIEVAQKAAFDALIVKAAYATGLDALPLGTIVAGFAALLDTSKPKQEPTPGGDRVQSDEASIDLVVEIGRNTSQERFAVLDQYLTWSGKKGEWSGKVTMAVLSIFEGLFEARQLKYSIRGPRNAESGSSNTSAPAADNMAGLAQDGDPTSPEYLGAVDPDTVIAGQAITAAPGPVEPTLQEAAASKPDEAAAPGREGAAATGGGHPETIGPATNASNRMPSASSASQPRSPLAGLRRSHW